MRRFRVDCDRLGHSRIENEILDHGLIQIDAHILMAHGSEPSQLGLDVVAADRKKRRVEESLFVCDQHSLQAGFHIADGDRHAGKGSPRTIRHCPLHRAGHRLSKGRNGEETEKESQDNEQPKG